MALLSAGVVCSEPGVSYAANSEPATTRTSEPATKTILDIAKDLTSGDRQRDYGHPRDNFQLIATLWSTMLGVEVTPRMVGRLMIVMKMARDVHTPKADNLVDSAGYARTMELLDEP